MQFAVICHRVRGSGQRLQMQLLQECAVSAAHCSNKANPVCCLVWHSTGCQRLAVCCPLWVFARLPGLFALALLPSLSGGGELGVLPARGSIPSSAQPPIPGGNSPCWGRDKAAITTAVYLEWEIESAPFTTLNRTAEHGCYPGHLPSRDSIRDDPASLPRVSGSPGADTAESGNAEWP